MCLLYATYFAVVSPSVMTIIGLERDVRSTAEPFMQRVHGDRECQYVMPMGGRTAENDDDGVVWYFDDRRLTGLVLRFLEGELVCITFLACLDDTEPDHHVGALVKTVLDDAMQQPRPLLARIPAHRREVFGRLGFVTLCTYMSDPPHSLMVHSQLSSNRLLALRNFDGNNPDLLGCPFPCSAPDCDRYGHHVCRQCRRAVFCTQACYARNRLCHMRFGCKLADHVVRRLLGRFNGIALPKS